ncbi:MAG: acyl carrier protein [Gallionellaceae bacterium]|nr:acyl carrier protein [Gallionellaceae bacterium]
MNNNMDTLQQVREAVGRVTGHDVSAIDAAQALNLDSISRISLLVELENTFQMPMDTEETVPESFESLASLTALIDSLR